MVLRRQDGHCIYVRQAYFHSFVDGQLARHLDKEPFTKEKFALY
jgi:hypothetical protein